MFRYMDPLAKEALAGRLRGRNVPGDAQLDGGVSGGLGFRG